MTWRGLKGALLGAGFGGAIGGILVGLFRLACLLHDTHPVDRADNLERLPGILLLAALAGIGVGAIGGLAARLPRKGMRSCQV